MLFLGGPRTKTKIAMPPELLPPDPARTRFVRSLDGTRIHIEEFGPDGAPVVVLAHGWTCSTLFWAPVIHGLVPDFRVVVYDQRGHGRSGLPVHDVYSAEALADDLSAVLGATVSKDGKAVLVGHSMGGMTVMAAADRADVRDRTAGVLLADTGADALVAEMLLFPFARRLPRLAEKVARTALRSPLPLGPVTAVGSKVLRYGTMGLASTPAQVDFCARIVHACPTRVRTGWARVLGTLDLAAHLPFLSAPVIVLVGADDRLTPPVHSRRIAKLVPNLVEYVELPGRGHMAPVEEPAAVVEQIRRLTRSNE